MTAFDYSRIAATAERLIERFGKPGTIIRKTQTGPAHAPETKTVTVDCTIVETDYFIRARSPTLIEAGHKYGIISASIDVPPEFSDDIEIDGEIFHFNSLDPLNPGGRVILYDFDASR